MRSYLIRRLLLVIPTLLIISLVVFLTLRMVPGDVVDMIILERGLNAEGIDRGAIERRLGLDLPVHVQYGRWLADIVLRGSLGESWRGQDPVTTRIFGRIAVTVELGLFGTLLGLLVSLPVGIYSALRQDTVGDYLGRSFAIVFLAVPSFWTATMVMIYPVIWWNWSPPLRLIRFADDPLGNVGMFLIPSFILGMVMAGSTMRMTRTMMLEVLRQDYIRTAWSKGLRERLVVTKHALKNALLPVVTVVGFNLPVLVGGAVIIEQIFALPGIGRLMLQALDQRDYALVSGINLVFATAVVLANLLVDISYGFLDPRVRYR